MYFSIVELMERYSCSRYTVYRWMQKPANPFPRGIKFGGALRFNESDVHNWEKKEALRRGLTSFAPEKDVPIRKREELGVELTKELTEMKLVYKAHARLECRVRRQLIDLERRRIDVKVEYVEKLKELYGLD